MRRHSVVGVCTQQQWKWAACSMPSTQQQTPEGRCSTWSTLPCVRGAMTCWKCWQQRALRRLLCLVWHIPWRWARRLLPGGKFPAGALLTRRSCGRCSCTPWSWHGSCSGCGWVLCIVVPSRYGLYCVVCANRLQVAVFIICQKVHCLCRIKGWGRTRTGMACLLTLGSPLNAAMHR